MTVPHPRVNAQEVVFGKREPKGRWPKYMAPPTQLISNCLAHPTAYRLRYGKRGSNNIVGRQCLYVELEVYMRLRINRV